MNPTFTNILLRGPATPTGSDVGHRRAFCEPGKQRRAFGRAIEGNILAIVNLPARTVGLA
jgi:hypothetical protein